MASLERFVKSTTDRTERSICVALAEAESGRFGNPLAALGDGLNRAAHLLDRRRVCSTDDARLSDIAATSSMDAAISFMADDVSSAAALRSSAFWETDVTEPPIVSVDFAVSVTETASCSVSRATPLIEFAISLIAVVVSCDELAISCAVPVTLWMTPPFA